MKVGGERWATMEYRFAALYNSYVESLTASVITYGVGTFGVAMFR